MPVIPNWLVGRHVTSCVLTPQSNTNGTLADTTPVATLTGHLDEITPSGRKRTEEISPMDTTQENNVPIKRGFSISVTEILKATGTNLLATAWYGTPEYFKMALVRGGQTITYYGLMTSYEEPLRAGKNVGVANFDLIDVTTANPLYS